MPETVSQLQRAPRAPFALQVAIRGHRGITFGKCQSLDARGLIIETEYPYQIQDELVVKFVLPGETEAIIGEAVVTDRQPGKPPFCWLGLSFVKIDHDASERITRFLSGSQQPAAGERSPEGARRTTPPPDRRRTPEPAARAARTPAPAACTARTPVPPARTATPMPPVKLTPRTCTARPHQEEQPKSRIVSQEFLSFTVQFRNAEDFVNEYAENISKGGIFIRTTSKASKDTPALIRLQLPGSTSSLYIEGRVVWSRDAPQEGLGIQFAAIDEAISKQIESYVALLGKTKPLTVQMWKFQHPTTKTPPS